MGDANNNLLGIRADSIAGAAEIAEAGSSLGRLINDLSHRGLNDGDRAAIRTLIRLLERRGARLTQSGNAALEQGRRAEAVARSYVSRGLAPRRRRPVEPLQ